ncbi:hypothetical protein C8Q77DRAFT_255475 [Trametes polyzona]|nr:hypothetical protein C8Q77DRAFT_255475 [Trametes polyzona]
MMSVCDLDVSIRPTETERHKPAASSRSGRRVELVDVLARAVGQVLRSPLLTEQPLAHRGERVHHCWCGTIPLEADMPNGSCTALLHGVFANDARPSKDRGFVGRLASVRGGCRRCTTL